MQKLSRTTPSSSIDEGVAGASFSSMEARIVGKLQQVVREEVARNGVSREEFQSAMAGLHEHLNNVLSGAPQRLPPPAFASVLSKAAAASEGQTSSDGELAAIEREASGERKSKVSFNQEKQDSPQKKKRMSITDFAGAPAAELLTSSFRRARQLERASKQFSSSKDTWAVVEADREVRSIVRDLRKQLSGFMERHERDERLRTATAATPASQDDRGSFYVRIVRASGLKAADRNGLSDPYIKLTINEKTVRSKTMRKTLDPIYEETFRFDGTLGALTLKPLNVTVMDYDVASFDDVIGMAQVDLVGLYYSGIAKDLTVNLDEGTVDLQVTWHTAGTAGDDKGRGGGDSDHGGGWFTRWRRPSAASASARASGVFTTARSGWSHHMTRIFGPVLHPDSRFRSIWNVMLAVMIVYCGIAIPLEIAFEADMDEAMCGVGSERRLRSECREFQLWFWLNVLVDVFFMGDILVNFRTGFVREGHFVSDGWIVAKNYLRGPFALDALGTFPVNLMTMVLDPTNRYGDPALVKDGTGGDGDVGRVNRLLRLVRIAKLIKLTRMRKLAKYMEDFEDFLNPGVLAVLKLTLIAIFCCHWIGCLWWLVSGLEMDDFATPWYVGDNLWHPPRWLKNEGSLATKYLHAFFWGAGMVTSLVPRDIEPATSLEAIITVASMFFGLILNALVISSLTQALASMDSKKEVFGKKLDEMKHFLMIKGAPRDMRMRVLDYYEYLFSSSVMLNDITRDQFEHMPPALSAQVNLTTTRGLITRCPLFHYVGDDTLVSLISTLDPLVCVPAQWVAVKGQSLENIYFIVRGRVQLSARGHEPARVLTNYDNFGAEDFVQACVDSAPATVTASARSITFCDVLGLATSTIETAVQDDADFEANIERRRRNLAERSGSPVEMKRTPTVKRLFGRRFSVGKASPLGDLGEASAIGRLGRLLKRRDPTLSPSAAPPEATGRRGDNGNDNGGGDGEARDSEREPTRGTSFRRAILRVSERISQLAPSMAPAALGLPPSPSPTYARRSPTKGLSCGSLSENSLVA